jgi:cytochrome P450
MIVANGDEHRRLRRGVAKYFGGSEVGRRWGARVQEVTQSILARLLEGRSTFDLDEFTKLPVIIVAEMLGIPEEHHEDFRRWSLTVTGNASTVALAKGGPDVRRRMDAALRDLNDYLTEEMERHRQGHFDDLLTVMMNLEEWSPAEIRSSAINFLLAGYDTTARLMGDCLITLERHPDQRRLLVDEPGLIPNAIEETLRWNGVSMTVARVVVSDTELAGTRLTAGDMLYVMLAAANRDPRRWENPDEFDVRRPAKAHLGFGGGPHICIGAPLARLEVKVALETMLRLVPEYRLRDIEYASSFFNRGPERAVIEAGVLSAS